MNKRGEISSTTLVTVFLLLIGFAILLFVILQIGWTGKVDREVCHQSVIYRASLPEIGGVREYVPLKCKTQKICVTSGFFGGECEEYKNAESVWTVKVSKGEEGKTQIEKMIAGEIMDCWATMGEGKVEVFGSWLIDYGVGTVGSSCVICSRIAFDGESLEKAGINVNEINVMKYMYDHAVPDKDISYIDYLSANGGKMSIPRDKNIEIVDFDDYFNGKSDPETETIEIFQTSGQDEINEIGIMFMQISTPTKTDVFKRYVEGIVGGFGGSFVLAPSITATAVKSPTTWIILAAFGVYQQGNTWSNRAITAGYCGDVSSGENARQGCSVVRVIDYGKEDISKYCSIVESIP